MTSLAEPGIVIGGDRLRLGPVKIVRQVRLDGVRHDLQQPELADRTIAEIGAVWGNHDSAWLSRAFKAEHEVTPTDLRRER
ncbi:helix-turn-helix domain-containing protein [Brevibacterium linens]|uniref:helix-turn-helix domain-containing protein n=1 Tax=Brevibacterium linens TaxID=1703 RepID=UPI0009E5B36F|nr:helix-turn-helix domain-containing protein [Brevibacterium linens]